MLLICALYWKEFFMPTTADRIEKKTVLRAPHLKVWQAISDPTQFGNWFGIRFDGPFIPGQRVTGKIVPTSVDPEIAKQQMPYKGHPIELWIDRVEPMQLFSFRWHPFANDPKAAYSNEPTTLIEFLLDEVHEGTQLTIRESGFDRIPEGRRAEAYESNEGGWTAQLKLIEKYLTAYPKE